MKRLTLVAAVWALAASAAAVPASAQYMYLDVNGDGVCNSSDVVDPSVSSVDVYVDTNHHADGTIASCAGPEGDFSIYSYTFILRWTPLGPGAFSYGGWTDNLGFPVNAGGRTAGNDMWLARASSSPLPPGHYKLGTLNVTVSGPGALSLLATDPTLDTTALTSFGSPCPGLDFDDTIKLGSDFLDSCGTSWNGLAARTTWEKIRATYR
ncbi:MAG TPA: hypothetical protein VF363_11110 [Candidatus Eisenbacteria bacterium]